MSATVLVDLTPLGTPTRWRGIGRYLRTLALGLSRLGPEETGGLRLVALTGLDLLGRARTSEDFATAADEVQPGDPVPRDRYAWAYARRLALWAAARRLGAEVVHLGDPNATPLGLRRAGCRRLVTCHDLIPLQFPEEYLGLADGYSLLGPRLIARRYRSADRVLAISRATRDELVRLLHLPESKIGVVHNGIDGERFTAAPAARDAESLRAHGLTPRRYALYVGDVNWRKNVEGMLGGLASAERQGHALELAFVGVLTEEQRARILSLASARRLEGRLRFLGFVPDEELQALYRGALAHLFVSRLEGFGYTVVEAMASGCPVVTTRCGSLGEVVGDAGLLVAPDDHEAIGLALTRLASDAALHAELSVRGQQRARRFSCEAQARGTLRAYRETLDAAL